MTHSGAKLFSMCEPVKAGKLSASKIQRWSEPRLDIPIPKAKTWKEKNNKKVLWVPRKFNT